MDAQVPLDRDVLDRTPPEVIELLLTLLDRIEKLEAENRELRAQLGRNSSNSSMPPSSDRPGNQPKRKPPQPPSGRKRGGQPGHPRHQRPLVPPEELDETIDCKPQQCNHCGTPLRGNDPSPRRHQVAEIPPFEPQVVEYRLHELTCPGCGRHSRGRLPPGVPRGAFGPRLAALVCVLAGAYRLGKRPIRQLLGDFFGLSISLGTISKLEKKTAGILEGPVTELLQYLRGQSVGIDETGWRENKRRAWLWAVVGPLATVFRVAASRGAVVVHALLGESFEHVISCDRWSAYRGYVFVQWCWAHLRRDFQAMIDRGGPGEPIGKTLLAYSDVLFEWWHRFGEGKTSRARLQRKVRGLREEFREALEGGASCRCPKTAGTCRQLLKDERRMWTFVWREGVDPTNNATERTLRHAVLWRKASGGTDSVQGSRFVERVLSIVSTCRQQRRNVLDYITACHQAALDGQPVPSLDPIPAKSLAAA